MTYVSKLCSAHPNRFGFFAALPGLEDLEGAISEIHSVFRRLKADRVTLSTSYAGQYLGSKEFEQVWAALDETRAVVRVHPNNSFAAAFTTPFLPQPLIDYPHETTRTASDLVLGGRKRQFPTARLFYLMPEGRCPTLPTGSRYSGRSSSMAPLTTRIPHVVLSKPWQTSSRSTSTWPSVDHQPFWSC